MTSELFGTDWIQKMEEQHEEAVAQFKAAVGSARSGSDEAIRQASFLMNFRDRKFNILKKVTLKRCENYLSCLKYSTNNVFVKKVES